jgi:hypothetical protein
VRLKHFDGTHLIDCLVRTGHPCPLRPGAFPRRPRWDRKEDEEVELETHPFRPTVSVDLRGPASVGP